MSVQSNVDKFNTMMASYDALGDPQLKYNLLQLVKDDVLAYQTAAVAGSQEAQDTLAAIGRQWIKNDTLADVEVHYAGLTYVFLATEIYCVDKEEAQFFRERSGGSLVSSTLADWVAATGVVKVFYW